MPALKPHDDGRRLCCKRQSPTCNTVAGQKAHSAQHGAPAGHAKFMSASRLPNAPQPTGRGETCRPLAKVQPLLVLCPMNSRWTAILHCSGASFRGRRQHMRYYNGGHASPWLPSALAFFCFISSVTPHAPGPGWSVASAVLSAAVEAQNEDDGQRFVRCRRRACLLMPAGCIARSLVASTSAA